MRKILLGLFLVAISLKGQNSPDQQWSFAEGLFKRGFYEDAMQEYQGLIVGGKTQLEKNALLRIITCCEQSGKNPEKYIDLYIAAESDINSKVVIQLKKAALLIKHNELGKAEKLYETITSQNSLYQEHALYEFGRLQLEQGKNQQAIKTFTDLSSKGDANDQDVRIYAHFALGSLYYSQKQLKKAENHFRILTSLRNHHPLKEKAFSQMIKMLAEQERDDELSTNFAAFRVTYPQNPEMNELTMQYAMSLIRQKKYDLARGELSNLKNLSPEQKLWHNYAYGICFYQLGFYKESVKYFQICSSEKSFTQNTQAAAYEIYAFIELNNLKKAQQKAINFSSRFPNSRLRAEVHYRIAVIALKTKNDELAIKQLSAALNSYLPGWENIAEAHKLLARKLSELERFKESAEIWQKLAGLSDEPQKSEFAFLSTENYLLAKQNSLALENLTRIKSSPENELRKLTLTIEIYLSEKNWVEVNQLIYEGFQKAKNDEDKALIMTLEGRSLFLQNKFKEAVEPLQKASNLLESPQTLSQSLILLANCHENLSQKKQAADAYKLLIDNKLTSFLRLSELQIKEISRLLEIQGALNSSQKYNELLQEKDLFYHIQNARLFLRMEKITEALHSVDLASNKEMSTKDQCALSAIRANLQVDRKEIDKARRTMEVADRGNQWHDGDFAIYLLAKARIHYELKEFEKAWKVANRGHILFNDPQFSPASLFTAIKSAVALGRLNDAKKLRNELVERFPKHLKRPNVANFIAKHITE